MRLNLPKVTLVAAASNAIDATLRALIQCLSQSRFATAYLLSDKSPECDLGAEIKWRATPKFTSRQQYSDFIFNKLHEYIETEFALCIQWDGYILKAENWSDSFLEYDYIGAPWPHFLDGNNVGNGGFSLRSKKLLTACAKLPLLPNTAEDIAICRYYRQTLETEHGIRFAPESVASRFSFERKPPAGNEFGFHGSFNFEKIMEKSEFKRLIKELEPGTIGRMESNQMMRAAILGGSPTILWSLIRNRIIDNITRKIF